MKETHAAAITRTAGFTLIELMITVAIIGILVSLSIPAYLDYAIRAKISEALQIAAAAKVSIAEFYISNGSLPATMSEAGIENVSTQYVSAVAYEKITGKEGQDKKDGDKTGRVVMTLSDTVGGGASGKKIAVEVRVEGTGLIKWKCKPAESDGVPKHLLPSSCRGA